MLTAEFTGDIAQLREGLGAVAPDLGVKVGPGGLRVEVSMAPGPAIDLARDGDRIRLRVEKPIHFFRALSLIAEHAGEKGYRVTEKRSFERCGALFDVSQGNAVMTVDTVKLFLRRMALMGLDTIMLYTEDSYEVPGEPYFGYMRGRYTAGELRAVDDYAHALGIEAIPCIQTLAHLHDALRWQRFHAIREDEETLLVGEEATYAFIEEMIAAASAPFRSRRIHIGMDEAWRLGQGGYLLRNGFEPKYRIMRKHLDRVLEITRRRGLSPYMWCDMFFRAIAANEYHSPDIVLTDEVIASFPPGVTPMGWEYYQFGESNYERFLAQHRRLSPDVAMAGGIWTWMGFVPDYDKTWLTTNYLLNAARKTGVGTVVATVWGDCGTESSVFSTLLGLQMYGEHAYAEREPTRDALASRLKACTGAVLDDVWEMTYLDKYERTLRPEGYAYANPTKALLWQDILLGLLDRNFQELGMDLGRHYAERGRRLREGIGRNGDTDVVLELLSRLCAVLEIKAEAGIKLSAAYRAGRREELATWAGDLLPELGVRVRALRDIHRAHWMAVNKPFGWEVLDLRYGGLLGRIETAVARLADYLAGRVPRLEELEAERLLYDGKPGVLNVNEYHDIATASRI